MTSNPHNSMRTARALWLLWDSVSKNRPLGFDARARALAITFYANPRRRHSPRHLHPDPWGLIHVLEESFPDSPKEVRRWLEYVESTGDANV
jgi:hypothetical protein